MTFSNLYHTTKSNVALKRFQRLVASAQGHEATYLNAKLPLLRSRAMELAPRLTTDAHALAELFALVREASRQVLGLRHHDVQLLGGLVLFERKLAEMRTGEGKTLTIAAPCIAAALSGLPVHVVTVNEYLASRDAESLRPLYEVFGLTVGVLQSGQPLAHKQAAYASSVVYGVNHEFGFDYLRDNMVTVGTNRVQRGLGFAIVDEVDSILIDEARTPLIISGTAAVDDSGWEAKVDAVVRGLSRVHHFVADDKQRTATFTDAGYELLESGLVSQGLLPDAKSLYREKFLWLLQHAGQSLLANVMYRRDKQYVVQGGDVVIVDESTGRLMKGRRWGEGLHEAVEAKEGLRVHARTQTQATITYQSFFGLYTHLAGLTGTAATEAEEFAEIYALETVVVPPNKPSLRRDLADTVFLTRAEKFAAVVEDVARRQSAGQPVLVGTASVADSDHLSALLTAKGVTHSVLNARQNAQEADVIASAGCPGAVTVATNMAGRGTDIALGGLRGDTEVERTAWEARREAVIAAGGLHVLGTERYESRRVDNQLRGRAGRQGDVGSSQFFISLEDRLLRVFAADSQTALSRLIQSDQKKPTTLLNKAVLTAQRRMEEQGFEARRELLKYDKVLAAQRNALYSVRNSLLDSTPSALAEQAGDLAEEVAAQLASDWFPADWVEDNFDELGFKAAIEQTFEAKSVPVIKWLHTDDLSVSEIRKELGAIARNSLRDCALGLDEATVRSVLLVSLDKQWVEHLSALDELRSAIGLRSFAQQNPVYAYAADSKRLFEGVRQSWAVLAVSELLQARQFQAVAEEGDSADTTSLTAEQRVALVTVQRFVTRNEPCPCGSGHRFKFCHGRL